MSVNQTRECWHCGKPETVEQIQLHHVYRRGSHPDLIDDPDNIVPLCVTEHLLTESNPEFYKRIQRLWEASLLRRKSSKP